MKVSVYSTAWSVISKSFDYRGALDNWFTFADEVSIAIPLADPDDSEKVIRDYATLRGYNVLITRTPFPIDGSDPFAYGKTENAALQACTGDVLVQENADERLLVRRERLEELGTYLQNHPEIKAFWVPTIDLYGSYQKCLPAPKRKWYIHGRGLNRGAVNFGLKSDGRPDYHKTSTDELVDKDHNLVPTIALLQDTSLATLKPYANDGWPVVFHLGYVDFAERLDRSLYWKEFWVKATAGDENGHPTSIEEMANRECVEHGLPMWSGFRNRT